MADGVADRALEAGGVEILLDQVIGHAERRRLEVDLVGGLAGEHDHGGERSRREAVTDQLEPGLGAQPVIDQVHVVTLLADGRQRPGVFGLPLNREARALLGREHVTGDQVVVLVVLDEQDLDPLSGWEWHSRHHWGARRSRTSTASTCA